MSPSDAMKWHEAVVTGRVAAPDARQVGADRAAMHVETLAQGGQHLCRERGHSSRSEHDDGRDAHQPALDFRRALVHRRHVTIAFIPRRRHDHVWQFSSRGEHAARDVRALLAGGELNLVGQLRRPPPAALLAEERPHDSRRNWHPWLDEGIRAPPLEVNPRPGTTSIMEGRDGCAQLFIVASLEERRAQGRDVPVLNGSTSDLVAA
jgi:hypothetical protein